MIKVIAFDLVGVLVREKDIEMTPEEEKVERLFGKNVSDSEFILQARSIIPKDVILIRTTENIINSLYEVKDKDLFNEIKKKYKGIKIVIATNHVTYIRNYIGEAFGVTNLDNIFISAEMHKVKPNHDFYEHIISKMDIKPDELLMIDDSKENIDGALELGIKTIEVNKDTNLREEIAKYF